jgi:hypothetical protein
VSLCFSSWIDILINFQKYRARSFTCDVDPDLRKHQPLIQWNEAATNSDEETDDEASNEAGKVVWAVRCLPWRNRALAQLLHFLDCLRIAQQKTVLFSSTERKIGRPEPAYRIRLNKESERNIPPGRSRTTYSDAFITKVTNEGLLDVFVVGPRWCHELPSKEYYDARAGDADSLLGGLWGQHKLECKECGDADSEQT